MKISSSRLVRHATGLPSFSTADSTRMEAISGTWQFTPLETSSQLESPNKSGWGVGSNDYHAVGLELEWVRASDMDRMAPTDYYAYRINNAGDLGEFCFDRYISLQFDPRPTFQSHAYQIDTLNVTRRENLLPAGSNLQIRTSFDQFQSPLIEVRGGERHAVVAEGAQMHPRTYKFASLMSRELSEPLEIRFYYYGRNLAPIPALAMCGPTFSNSPIAMRFFAVSAPGIANPPRRSEVRGINHIQPRV